MENIEKMLTEKQLSIYNMRESGCSVEEIAEAIGCSRKDVYGILFEIESKIEEYKGFIDDGLSEEEALNALNTKRSKGRGGKSAGSGRQAHMMIEYKGRKKSFSEWCEELEIDYMTAYMRYKSGWPPERIFGTPVSRKNKTDYTIKDEYDMSLISDEYREILVRKNNGESFAQIARDIGQTSANVQTKAKAAINKLQRKEADRTAYMRKQYNELKNNEEYMKKKREYSRKWYSEHFEQERERGRNRAKKRREDRIKTEK